MDAWVWRTDHWARPPRRSVFLHYLGALNSLYYVSLVINSQRVSKSAAQTHQMCIVVPEPWHRSHLGIRPGTACFPNAVNTSAQIWKQYWLFLRPEVNREFLIGVEEAELLQTDETAGIRLHLGQQSQWFFQIFEVLSKRISSEPPTHTHTHTYITHRSKAALRCITRSDLRCSAECSSRSDFCPSGRRACLVSSSSLLRCPLFLAALKHQHVTIELLK